MNRQIRILIVDDEKRLLETMSRRMTKKGFEVETSASGEKALEMIRAKAFNVIVLDLRMEGMDGLATLSEIRRLRPDARVIMLTGHGDRDMARKALEMGACDFLTKPCDLDLLSTRINDACARASVPSERNGERMAGDLMIPISEYTTVREDQTVAEAVDALMKSFEGLRECNRVMETGHRSVLVFDRGGNLVGVVGIRDLIKHIRPAYLLEPTPTMADAIQFSPIFWQGLFTDQALQMGRRAVAEIMSPPPPSVAQDSTLMETADLLYAKGVRRLIVKKDGNVIGVIREQELFFEIAGLLLARTV